MRHDPKRGWAPSRPYRPERAWLGRPGDGAPLRGGRAPAQPWRMGRRELRVLALALVVGALAWGQLLG